MLSSEYQWIQLPQGTELRAAVKLTHKRYGSSTTPDSALVCQESPAAIAIKEYKPVYTGPNNQEACAHGG